MSAYRQLTDTDLEAVRSAAGADALLDCAPIHAGIENSNWFLTLVYGTRRQPCVLTLLEQVPSAELPYFIALTDVLAEADLPVPMALPLTGRRRQFRLQGRPALLLPRLPGTHVTTPEAGECRAAGHALARLHAAAKHCPFRRIRPDHQWWPAAFASVAPLLDASEHDELAAALLDATRAFAHAHALPHGVVHGDFFRDNVLMSGGSVSGVLDFFHAGEDLLAWDIAIALNDWAVVAGSPDTKLADAFLDGYAVLRPLTGGESALLPALRRAAAARFWLSRLIATGEQAGAGDAVQRKDPQAMRMLYRQLAD